jgi:hypothetical protein
MRNRRSGRGMVGVLVAGALGLVVVLFFVMGGMTGSTPPPREDGKGTTLVGRVAYEAKDEVCKSNLGQVKQAIQMATDPVEGAFPSSLEETKLGADFLKCPIGKEAYVYDPTTGKVTCPHPGHQAY